MLCVLPGFAVIRERERERDREREREREIVAFIVFLLSCDCPCYVHLLHGNVGWPVVFGCGISRA